ncbi:FAD/NAD(P)-binding protein [Conexibacter sp. CPCC 206217]|uniref:FAD/NAD(P)-binding protein n=1 Tax=Conexibacter sp. CPCC 206217 TaxID=3064574 RepID=UPI0027210902|nr:FAD/NAD(P)-binding protein [Conexibacter sp. CPCC 206217]MDO8212309.1 FAD/NAD(P)-binding protein [Conexibacter sp. CPCC 206217]
MTRTVAIVGAGAAGTLTAVNLLRRGDGPSRVVLIERSGTFGPGVAYSTTDERHRLNVVAERMSAFEDEPGHFADWAQRTVGPTAPGAYLPRAHFGAYLRDLLDAAERGARGRCRLERVVGEVVAVEPGSRGATAAEAVTAAAAFGAGDATTGAWGEAASADATGATVVFADGRRIAADDIVLALGSLPAARPSALPDDPRVIAAPWAPGALDEIGGDETSLLIGSGLTGVDVALSLCGRSDRSRAIAISRGGCLPYEHLPGVRAAVPAPELPAAPASADGVRNWLERHVRSMRGAGHDWREVVDGVRPHVPRLWQSLPPEEQRRFVREHGRAWELRRHRMAPESARRVRRLLDAGQLLVRAGRVVAVRALERNVEVLVAGDGDDLRTLRADRVVLCAGAGTDVRRASSPLLQGMLASGVASADPLSLGLRATPDGALLAADGTVQPHLHLLGPLRRGELWETTAMREIRNQAQTVAHAIAG